MRTIRIAAAFLAVAMFSASPARAHDPIIFTIDQKTPEEGPLLPDGTVSFALYGVLEGAGDSRGFRVNFKDGDPYYFSLLIPDLAPENLLAESDLPVLSIVDPSGAESVLVASERVPFPEPFTGTNYVRLIEVTGVALGGSYAVTVRGDMPARFTVSVGTTEMFGTPVENVPNRELGVTGVMQWYETPPPAPPTTTTLPPTPVESSTVTNDTTDTGSNAGSDGATDGSSISSALLVILLAVTVGGGGLLLLRSRRRERKR